MAEEAERLLQRDELHLVTPKLRRMVEAAWARGEDVPYAVTDVIDLTDPIDRQRHRDQIAYAERLVKEGR